MSEVSAPDVSLLGTIDRLAHLLPAQGPISIFIHPRHIAKQLGSRWRRIHSRHWSIQQ